MRRIIATTIRIFRRAFATLVDAPFWALYGGAWLLSYIIARAYMAVRLGVEDGINGITR